jgi:hypothetical protein
MYLPYRHVIMASYVVFFSNMDCLSAGETRDIIVFNLATKMSHILLVLKHVPHATLTWL